MTYFMFFFNDTATTEIYTPSLHDALPIYGPVRMGGRASLRARPGTEQRRERGRRASARKPRERAQRPGTGSPDERPDRQSTRLNSSHANISYAVFCLNKKKCNIRMRITGY